MAATIRLLMTVRGVPNRKALAQQLASYGMSQSTLYSRLGQSTDWQAAELAALGAVLKVPPAVFFCPPDVESIAPMIGLSTEELVKALVVGSQNWKSLTVPDLGVIDGEGRMDSATRKGQLSFRTLYAVPD